MQHDEPEHVDEIDSLQFGLMSSDDILKFAVCEINSTRLTGENSVYDPRLGSLDENIICPTCNQSSKLCMGHFGYIKVCIQSCMIYLSNLV